MLFIQVEDVASEVKELADCGTVDVSIDTAQLAHKLYELTTEEAGEKAVLKYYDQNLPTLSDVELILLAQNVFSGKFLFTHLLHLFANKLYSHVSTKALVRR